MVLRARALQALQGAELTQLDPAELPAELVPLAWLLGTWSGVGVGRAIGTAASEDFRFGQELAFSTDGRPFLAYSSRTWVLDEAGMRVRPDESESGYWRPRRADPPGQFTLEVVLAHHSGVAEVYLGVVDGAKIELSTDVVARTESALPYSAAHRLYGQVEGDLLYAVDTAVGEQPLTPQLSARLKRTAPG